MQSMPGPSPEGDWLEVMEGPMRHTLALGGLGVFHYNTGNGNGICFMERYVFKYIQYISSINPHQLILAYEYLLGRSRYVGE